MDGRDRSPTPSSAREPLARALAINDLANIDACAAITRHLALALSRGDLGEARRHTFDLIDDLDRTRRGLAVRGQIEMAIERKAEVRP